MAVRKTSTKTSPKTSSKTVTKTSATVARPKTTVKRKTTRKTSPQTEPVVTISEMNESTVSGSARDRISSLRNNRYFLPLVLVILVLVLGYLFAKWAIIAFVDYRPITRFALYNQLDQKFGDGIKEQMISEALIKNEASKRGVSVSEDDVNAEFKKYEDQLGSKDALESALKAQNIPLDDFRNQLKIQLLIKKMFGQNVSVTDEEINQQYEQNKEQYQATATEDASATAKIHDQIKDQLTQQKISENFRKWLADAQKSNRVIRY